MAGAAQRDQAGHDPSGGASRYNSRLRASQFAVIQIVASSLKVEVKPVNLRDAGEIEEAVAAFARVPNGGLIVTSGAGAIAHRDLIITLVARSKLPAVYWERFFAVAGRLVSYGPDIVDNYRRAPDMSTASSRARSRPTYRSRRRASTSWLSTSRLRKRSALTCLHRCSPAPTR